MAGLQKMSCRPSLCEHQRRCEDAESIRAILGPGLVDAQCAMRLWRSCLKSRRRQPCCTKTSTKSMYKMISLDDPMSLLYHSTLLLQICVLHSRPMPRLTLLPLAHIATCVYIYIYIWDTVDAKCVTFVAAGCEPQSYVCSEILISYPTLVNFNNHQHSLHWKLFRNPVRKLKQRGIRIVSILCMSSRLFNCT
jgi:hypothetical protein